VKLIEATPSGAAARSTLTLEENTQALLDRAQLMLQRAEYAAAFRLLCPPLSALWTEARSCGLEAAMRTLCREHPLHALVQQDPFTERAATKPRGYAGDAVMMDFIYQGTPPEGTSQTGAGIFSATTQATMGLSVRYRRQLLKSLIDDTVVTQETGRMLSVASGHCRELEGSLVQSPHFLGEFVAFDQDPESCAEVQRVHAQSRVKVVNQGVRDLLSGPTAAALGSFDLIYSAGLYDYLPDGLARRLTARLLQMLRPGGRLLIGNFVPTGSGRAYMELFMDWELVLRNEAAMVALAQAAGASTVSSFHDPHRNVVYIDMLADGKC
jgi:extracellular factor (EF) 3-hydroxypalmitic acid methyl ester biosynthesis protein